MEDAVTVAELIELLKDCDPSAKVAFSLDNETVGYIDDLLLMTIDPEKTKLLGLGKRRKAIFLSGVSVDGITFRNHG